jgi:hypothetical protein
MDAFRLTCQCGLLVAEKMGEAAAADTLQRGLDANGRIERYGTHTDRLRHQPICSKQSKTPLGLAARLNADCRRFEQLLRHVEDRPGIAILELEFDFADRCDGIAFASTDFALVSMATSIRADESGLIAIVVRVTVVTKTGRNSSSRTTSDSHLPVFGASRAGCSLGIRSSHSFLSNTSI